MTDRSDAYDGGMATTAAPVSLRDELLLAAQSEIDEHGVGAVTLRGVARRVGVSHQAPGHHFKDRVGLLTELAVKGFRALERDMLKCERRNARVEDPVQEIANIGITYVEFARRNPALFAVMFRPELHRPNDADLRAARLTSFAVLQRAVANARAQGWGEGHSEQTLALTCWSVVHGTVQLWRDGSLDTFFPGATFKTVTYAVTRAVSVSLGRKP
jgi:AcrR family transcriptional regulator